MLYQHVCVRNYHGSQCPLKKKPAKRRVCLLIPFLLLLLLLLLVVVAGFPISHLYIVPLFTLAPHFLTALPLPTPSTPQNSCLSHVYVFLFCDLLILTRAWPCGCRFGRIYWSLVGSPLGTQLKAMAASSPESTSCQSIAQRGSIGAHKPLSNP